VCPATSRPGRGTPQDAQIRGIWTRFGNPDEEMVAAVTDYNAAEGFVEGRLCVPGPWGEPVSLDDGSRRMRKLRFKDVVDGLSKTISLFERAGLPDRYYGSQATLEIHTPPNDMSWGNVGMWAVSGEEMQNHLQPEPNKSLINTNNQQGMYSFHSGGIFVAFGDNAVKFLSDDTDLHFREKAC
jgi:hypothetical protein